MRWDRLPNPWVHTALAIIVSLLLVVLSYGGTVFREGSLLFSGTLRWAEWPAAAGRQVLVAGFSWFEKQEELLQANRDLSLENLRLRGLLAEEQVQRLQSAQGQFLNAQVIYRPPDRWWQEIRVNRGLLDGVRPGDAVLSNGFLVGRVGRTASRESWVDLLTSPSLLIPVVVDSTRDLGVVNGTGDGRVQLLYIPPERALEEGMTVSTALVSESLQPGIPLGNLGMRDAGKGTFSPYRLVLGADLSRLYHVSLFITQEEGNP